MNFKFFETATAIVVLMLFLLAIQNLILASYCAKTF